MELNTNPLRLDYVGINYEFEHVNERKAEVQKLAAEGVTQTKIAEKMGVSQQAVSKMLNDEVPF
jgi:transcriptional regulator with XRE-family HTH domain